MRESRHAQKNPFLGSWRILEMEVWDRDYIDLVVPGHVTFDLESQGEFQFGSVRGWIDCRFSRRDNLPFVEFSWEGESEMDPACGRGWASLQDDQLQGRIYIHNGDDSAFAAAKQ